MAALENKLIKGHSVLAKALIDNGVDTIFGLIGDANLFFVDSFVREHGGNYIAATNEANATSMAIGYANASGRIGVATVTHGPGLTNICTTLVEAVKGRVPLVVMCGDTAAEDRENIQDISQRDIVVATGAGFEQLRSARTMAHGVSIALRRAIVERRPVVLNMPIDMQQVDITYSPVRFKVSEKRGLVPTGTDLDNAIGIIAAAKRPIVLAGYGASSSEARSALLRLAERTGALLATSLKGKDLFRDQDFNIGLFGTLSTPVAVDLIMEADCVIAFGASLNKYTTSGGVFLKGKRVIQVCDEQAEVGNFASPDAGLVGDTVLVAETILHWLDEAEIPSSGFRNEDIKRRLRNYTPGEKSGKSKSSDSAIEITDTLLQFNKLLPEDRFLVTDIGRFALAVFRLIDAPDVHSFMLPSHFGAVGLGMSQAIGVAKAVPGKPVVLFSGDGGFMLGGMAEFNTAVRYQLDLIVVVCNDGSYGAEHVQFRAKDLDPSLSIFDWPDFASVANVLGGKGLTVRAENDLLAVAEAIKTRNKPLLIDLKLDPDR
ncbi:thiamine pyrophosphate-dependent acetolactate synthase large subunit-like protein [Bradyrhizobium macuxiense]|uniref:Thiamine pyrophosphate-dependent acetolactate synthase large subunit-like protein n=1 Tax=Bradyrhizobium macuxiense TaxID=1755647 RepID=A0A560KWX7_9BRAD|nr:thiamine pyrophosphate-binding protein [Bradyrhizobium macuxiense]TWB87736.1 thiamine pyrophosphate-dependent acetolactate synthase large subunit-like protein [Bradyrhizobium macuxiense]